MGIERRHRAVPAAPLVLLLLAAGCTGVPDAPAPGPSAARPGAVAAPGASGTPVARVCGAAGTGPVRPPAGAVTVDPAVAGDLAAKTAAAPAGTVFWLGPGRHLLAPGPSAQVEPKRGDRYLGAPGAVLDGGRTHAYAFGGTASGVTLRHLTVRGFAAPRDEGVVNHDMADGWVIEHVTIEDNSGAGLMAGARQRLRSSCLRRNGQYGMNAYKTGDTITGLVVEGNEITGNNTDDWERREPGCGCAGGIKFWAVDGADVRGNWVHDNRGPGLWADTDNNDFLVEGNLLEGNDGAALIYETSYNAVVRNNTLRRNGLVEGRAAAEDGDDFPYAAVYVSESGGEPRVPARTDRIEISGNVLEDNWSGITLWEDADRFCGSPANTSAGYCTRLVADPARCAPPGIAAPPLRTDCRWRTRRVEVRGNRFALDPAAVGCAGGCGRMAVLGGEGTAPAWSPYRGSGVAAAVARGQENRWHDNVYTGPWTFVAEVPGRTLDFGRWRAAPYRQDAGSTLRAGRGAR
ncbi:right-handed parallel beta-helix repeat-containing protein [Streptomyces termitum]|uniref:right-handed parallel beta-helix repeat-containing protein n=1 Tax=Streptomyces termitum TaxID=67368 RepID=UPI0037A78323